MAASRPSRSRPSRSATSVVGEKTKNLSWTAEGSRDGSLCASRARPRAREESAVSVVSKLSRPGLLDSNTTGNMIIVLSAGARRRSFGRGRRRRGQKRRPDMGLPGSTVDWEGTRTHHYGKPPSRSVTDRERPSPRAHGRPRRRFGAALRAHGRADARRHDQRLQQGRLDVLFIVRRNVVRLQVRQGLLAALLAVLLYD